MVKPTDPLFARQWHLLNTGQNGGTAGADLNVTSVWDNYNGSGIIVAVHEGNAIESTHPDIDANIRTDLSVEAGTGASNPQPDYTNPDASAHAHAVAGIIGAESGNGIGGVGVAPGASLYSIPIKSTAKSDASWSSYFAAADVVNNSWGYGVSFVDNFTDTSFIDQAYGDILNSMVTTGRNGLGTTIVWASGNGGENNADANAHNFTNSRETLVIGAADTSGAPTTYSVGGSVIHALGFANYQEYGDAIVTTDFVGTNGYNVNTTADGGDYASDFDGTSAAAPTVAGVVALMLQANPQLGYRDVQEIIAYTSRNFTSTASDWSVNKATNFNGGGLEVSGRSGFGVVDALAAVRVAEAWTKQATRTNEVSSTGSTTTAVAIPASGSVTSTIDIPTGIEIDNVEFGLNINYAEPKDLVMKLTSPDGTVSTVLNRPYLNETQTSGGEDVSVLAFPDQDFRYGAAHFWGEAGAGTWTLTIDNQGGSTTGSLDGWSLQLYGDTASDDDVFIFTDEFDRLVAADSSRATISDTAGTDTLNAAAVSQAAVIDLRALTASSVDGQTITLTGGQFENVVTGDGNDSVTGTSAANSLFGGRGDDTLFGGAGADTIEAGPGADKIGGGIDADVFQFGSLTESGTTTITDFGTGDQISVDQVTLTSIAAGDGASAGLGEVFVSNDGTNTTLMIGTNAAAGADITVSLSGVYADSAFTVSNGSLTGASEAGGLTTVPVYRFQSIANSSHFFTSSGLIRDTYQSTPPEPVVFNGESFRVFTSTANGLVPVYQFVNSSTGASLFTADDNERAFLDANASVGFTNQGIAFYAFDSAGDNRLEVQRYRHTETNGHFLTASTVEAAFVDQTLSGAYASEGGKFFVYAPDLLI